MANLCEGNRVWTAVAGPAASADINELQDQLRAMCGPQTVDVFRLRAMPEGAVWTWHNHLDRMVWRCAADTSHISFPIPFRSGQKVTAIDITASRSGAATNNGYFRVRRASATPAAGLLVAEELIGQLNVPYSTGADGVFEVRAIDDDGSGGAGLAGAAFAGFVIAGDYDYWIDIGGDDIRTVLVSNVVITAQFGN